VVFSDLSAAQLGFVSALAVAVLATAWAARVLYSIVRWKAYIWLFRGGQPRAPSPRVPDARKHLIFTMVDHYEPGCGPAGTRRNEDWLAAFRPIADGHRDSFGNRFRYTWFYPYEHKNEDVLVALCHMAYQGYGEVEFHWHHAPASNETFTGMLREAIAWFQRYGAMISSGPEPRTHFGFIHGNWALDNSLPICGVSRELQILFQHGCYADFTFSTIGTLAQPRKVNAIYYPAKGEGPKSYDDGVDAEVGVPVDDRLMIFQGPIRFHWLSGHFEYGAVESFAPPSPRRIHEWLDANIHVRGRPEWVFVKVYSHGSQSAAEVLHGSLSRMLDWLEAICRQRGVQLHYMSAREAYNVVKAAEQGLAGNPEEYRDFRIPKPCNMLFHTKDPVAIDSVTPGAARVRQIP